MGRTPIVTGRQPLWPVGKWLRDDGGGVGGRVGGGVEGGVGGGVGGGGVPVGAGGENCISPRKVTLPLKLVGKTFEGGTEADYQ